VGKERDGAEKQPEDSESKSEKTTEMQERKCSRWGMMEVGEEEKSFDYST
jgi:hypothetical protein